MTRVAAVDCGTNTIRLLIADAAEDGTLREVDRRLEVVRLGQGIDATGEFHPDALARTFAAVDAYAEAIRAAGVSSDRIHFVATSATRDAGNREEFFAGIEQRLGVRPDVISGETEAQLSFSGALSTNRVDAEPVLVMDIGGGSTELILGSAAGDIDRAVSLDIGSVRITERFLKVNPPAEQDVATAAEYVDDLIAASGVNLAAVRTWIGVAGTATTLGALQLGLKVYDREQVHGSRIPRDQFPVLLQRLSRLTVEEIRALGAVHPKRADVITAGTLIASRVAEAATGVPEMVVSENDILDGIALRMVQR